MRVFRGAEFLGWGGAFRVWSLRGLAVGIEAAACYLSPLPLYTPPPPPPPPKEKVGSGRKKGVGSSKCVAPSSRGKDMHIPDVLHAHGTKP